MEEILTLARYIGSQMGIILVSKVVCRQTPSTGLCFFFRYAARKISHDTVSLFSSFYFPV